MIDITDTSQGDLDLSTGDMHLSDNTYRHQSDILLSAPGDWSETPLLGVGIADYINDNDHAGLLRTAARQMHSDGMKVQRIGFNAKGEIEIEANYENNNNRG